MKRIIVAALISFSFLFFRGSHSAAQSFPTLAQDQEVNQLFTGLLDARSQIPAVSSMPTAAGSFPLGSVGQVSYSGPGISANPSSLFGSEGGPLFAVSGQAFTTSFSMPAVSAGGLGLLWPGSGQQTQGLGVPDFTSLNTQALTGPSSIFNPNLNSMFPNQTPGSSLFDLSTSFIPSGSSTPTSFSGGTQNWLQFTNTGAYTGAAGPGATLQLPTLQLSSTPALLSTPSSGGAPVSSSSSGMPSNAELTEGAKYFGATAEQAKQYWLTHSE
jgi:hypothetical protein